MPHEEHEIAASVFLSYSHDSVEHGDTVLALSNRLREEGINCCVDQYEESPPEGWPMWMDRQIHAADFVLMICSEMYFRKVMGQAGPDEGLGVRWEGRLIYQHLYSSGVVANKFIPVLLNGGQPGHIPTPVRGSTFYDLGKPGEFDKLYWRLRGVKLVERPPLGKLRPLPEKPRKTNPGLFLTGFIDVSLWGAAGWSGVFFMHDGLQPPWLGLVFRDENAAAGIFEQWHKRLGRADRYEEMRLSIVEGRVPGKPAGYTVHISGNIENILRRADDQGLNVPRNQFIIISRLHRMTPETGSPNLDLFRKEFRKFQCYQLFPAVLGREGLKLHQGLAVLKKEIVFRHTKDITSRNDPDAAVLPKFLTKPKAGKKRR